MGVNNKRKNDQARKARVAYSRREAVARKAQRKSKKLKGSRNFIVAARSQEYRGYLNTSRFPKQEPKS